MYIHVHVYIHIFICMFTYIYIALSPFPELPHLSFSSHMCSCTLSRCTKH